MRAASDRGYTVDLLCSFHFNSKIYLWLYIMRNTVMNV